jgi:ATP-dependent Clp protease adaptor protein ClpS
VLSHPSPATRFALDQGATALKVMQHLAHGHLGSNAGLPLPKSEGPPEERVAELVILNDEFTAMDFVVHVLEGLLGMKSEDAERTTLQIHQDGRASCGTYFLDEAQQRAASINAYARRHGMPLRCVLTEPG